MSEEEDEKESTPPMKKQRSTGSMGGISLSAFNDHNEAPSMAAYPNLMEDEPSSMSSASVSSVGIVVPGSFHDISVCKNSSKLPFNEKKKSRKYEIMKKLKENIYTMFEDNGMTEMEDCVEFLTYMEKDLNNGTSRSSIETAVANQMASLSLPDTNTLIALLSHQNGELNEEMLQAFPAMRKRSTALLGAVRKTRSDMIDLQFISDFMHDYCR
jgi:hypothetical protein